MTRTIRAFAAILLLTGFVSQAQAYDWAWWYPQDPVEGDTLTFTFEVAQSGEINGDPTDLFIWWGLDGPSGWIAPDDSTWPAGSADGDAGLSVQSPMVKGEDGKWRIKLITHEGWSQLNFVFTTRPIGVTTGGDWAHAPGGGDWGLPLDGTNGTYAAPDTATASGPVVDGTWETFVYDTRNPDAPYDTSDIVTAYLRGSFNDWDQSMPMNGPDERGVYWLDTKIPTGYNEYKFYFDLGMGNNDWISDPESQNRNTSDNNNSIRTAVLDTLPSIRHLTPFMGTRAMPGDTIWIEGQRFAADDSVGFLFDPVITSLPITGIYDLTIDTTGWFRAYMIAPNMSGRMEILAQATDDSGRTGSAETVIAIYPDSAGYHALDAIGDATGAGEYTAPTGSLDALDLVSLNVTSNATNDSLIFAVGYVAPSTETRTLIHLATGIDGLQATQPYFDTEMNLPDWEGRGIQVVMASPSASDYDPAIHNRLIVGRSPAETGTAVTMTSDTSFVVALSDLEAELGTFNSKWVIGAYSFYGYLGNSFEMNTATGGSADEIDPDVYDILLTETTELQSRMLANYSAERSAGLEALGRGFGYLDPAVVDSSLSIGGPALRFITRDYATLNSSYKVWCNRSEGATTGIKRWYDGGSSVAFTGGGPGDYYHTVELVEGLNVLRLFTIVGSDTVWSPTLTLERIVKRAPEANLFSEVNGDVITLDASQSTDPHSLTISYEWSADPDNPEATTLTGANTATPTLTAPSSLGEYYFNVRLENTNGDTSLARTMFTVHADSIEPFNLGRSAPWIRDAVVYEIFPRAFSSQGDLAGITADIDRIADLGATTIWLMPIFAGPSDHGYETTDYYSIEGDYGTKDDLRDLVEAAHARGLKVVLDLVVNHCGIGHPFMQDRLTLGNKSNYYSWFDMVVNQPNETVSNEGYTYFYDWLSLPNFDHTNQDVSHYLIEMSKYWVEEFDIDGYRCDVAWGVESRTPQFWQDWRKALKTIKPEVMLLAEAGVGDFTYLTNRFDMAYDWTLHHDSRNSFSNLFGISTATGLQTNITNHGFPFPDFTYPFRFMENHDENRYVAGHTVTQTTSAAALLLTIPGVPLIYNGQEVGETSQRGLIGWNEDTYDLQFVYRRLIEAREMLPSLRGTTIDMLDSDNLSEVYSYARYVPGNNPVVVMLNVGGSAQTVTATLPVNEWGLQSGQTYFMTDLLGGTSIQVTPEEISTLTRNLGKDGVLVYAITSEELTLDAPEFVELPSQFELHQNYPNPFNPTTLIRFDIPNSVKVRLSVYNVLGQTVRTLVDRPLVAGSHVIRFDGLSRSGNPLPSGVYFYRIEAGKNVQTKKMLLVK